MPPFTLNENNGETILCSKELDLKIATDREIFIRKNHIPWYGFRATPEKERDLDPAKTPEEKLSARFTSINRRVKKGLTKQQKFVYLISLREKILEKLVNKQKTQVEESDENESDEDDEQEESSDIKVIIRNNQSPDSYEEKDKIFKNS